MVGAPSTQWWVALASAIVFEWADGPDLIVTPALQLRGNVQDRAAGGPAGRDRTNDVPTHNETHNNGLTNPAD